MGFGIKELIVILIIVLLLFGTKKLKGIGTDLGGAIKGFKKSMADDDKKDDSVEQVEEKPAAEQTTVVNEQKDKSV
ncbi:sec-independent protein translocase protein TatA [Litorivivens lipolytica]|uniref:Sec-independent protein translocase protein TatA n=1 Tax=Litorivivens lipolytica TaxID=1524264 RepID=A0A7W4Z7B8_9GAMM|nr:twin-arginine translocase TatA/TatE family subunit [Litorivivens lipolytica]MBB3047761.1 sec-independent protein translocase protein TatA [Litorivivens lipolytica]